MLLDLNNLPSWPVTAGYVFVAGLAYYVSLVVYRLYLSPLRKFPGPKLAAATQWYETYYEMIYNGGGMFTKQIKKLHEEYGPIVRINPWEVHIDDPEFYETVYAPSAPYDKLLVFQNRFSIPKAAFSTADHVAHKRRRAALTPFFTKSKIQNHAPFIQNVVNIVCDRLENEFKGKKKPVTLNDMFACVAGDVTVTLAFGQKMGLCESETWKTPFTRAMDDLVASTHLNTQFPFMVPVADAIPDSLLAKSEAFRPIIEFRHDLNDRIRKFMGARDNQEEKVKKGGDTVFEVLLNSKLGPEELTEERLQHEAVSIIGAGFDTSRQMLTMIAFHIIDNPHVYKRLHEELVEAIPDPKNMPSWPQLQALPWLSACIEEGLRIGFGTVQRSPRISPRPIEYKDYIIPPGTPFSQDSYHMHSNETIFPESSTYKPERWLGNPKGPDGVKQLSRYMVAYSRGSRMCLGMQMADCELYLMMATMFRRFEFEFFETDRSDVDFYVDWLTPHAKLDSKGVRVLVN